MLKVENVTKYYDELKAVDNLSFEVNEGEIFGLLGVNGSGKTTTFRMILGLLDRNGGNITLNGKTIDYTMTDKIGFLTEERSLLTKLTVKEQVLYYATLKGMSEKSILKELDVWLKKFKMEDYLNTKIKELSKGNQQKIQFITAVIHKPKLLILDEPFSGLDPINVEEMKNAIRELKEQGSMIIFSSHRMEHVELFCEKLVILVKGKNVLSGELSQIKKDFQKQTIYLRANANIKELEKIDGVYSVTKTSEEYIIKVDNLDKVQNVFKYVKKLDNVTKFNVEEASLNEIFLSKVGEAYEK